MEERRFDDLTRMLGKATSRRQVLKGLLGGLAAAVIGRAAGPRTVQAAPEVCSRAHCRAEALQLALTCSKSCAQLTPRHGYRHGEAFGCQLGCYEGLRIAENECADNPTGCLSGLTCCEQQCISIENDPQHCGACGNVCQPGEACVDGQCQCGEHGTLCDGQCVDTQIDSRNCGGCGHVCPTCEVCAGGQCGALDCGEGNVCCKDQCISLCPGGIQPDPTTCQCPVCDGKTDGTPCGSDETCCGGQCIDSQSDPDNCGQCGHSCGSCATCQQGTCVPVADQTACGDGQVCCGGSCQDTCTTCKEGTYPCIWQPEDNQPTITVCCPTGASCCGGAGSMTGVCGSIEPCCAQGTHWCGDVCCESSYICLQDIVDNPRCCPANSSGVTPTGVCCGPNEMVVNCSEFEWVCCANGSTSCC